MISNIKHYIIKQSQTLRHRLTDLEMLPHLELSHSFHVSQFKYFCFI